MTRDNDAQNIDCLHLPMYVVQHVDCFRGYCHSCHFYACIEFAATASAQSITSPGHLPKATAMPFPEETIQGICKKSLRFARGVLAEHFRIYNAQLELRRPCPILSTCHN